MKKNWRGFTIVEIVVSIMVLSLFIMVIMYMYSRSSDSFRITLWKQERTAQAEIFWARMRKHIEEATNILNFGSGVNPTLNETPRPLKYHPDPDSVVAGRVLAWGVTITDFSFTPPFAHDISDQIFFLEKNGRRVTLLEGGAVVAQLDDVVQMSFRVSSVMKNPDNSEIITPGSDPAADGTLLEISVTLSPPDGYMAANQRIPQNHKFRLNVSSGSDPAPSY